MHMDGARLMNAAIASGIDAAAYGAPMDSLWLDFTKGLGAPLGAVLAGSREFIGRAARYKWALGGAMRQAGIAAAGCLHALDHHVARLAEDHHQAARLAAGLQAMPGVSLVYGPPATNIVFFEVSGTGLSCTEFASRCLARGLRIGPVQGRIRAVTHLDVSPAQIDRALAVMTEVVANAPGA
ncbi:MAG: beta-eliminating lyase-related protein [Burkholderiaceae bacterium]